MDQINKNPTIEDWFLYYYLGRMRPYTKGKAVQRYDFDLMKSYGVSEILSFAKASLNQNFTQANTAVVFAELGKMQFHDFVKYSKELPNMFWVLKFDHFKDLLSSSPKLNYDVLECADTIVNIIVPNLLAIKKVTAQDILDHIQLNEIPFQASPALAQDTSDFLTKFYLVP